MKLHLRLRKNWDTFVTPEETERHRQIICRCNERGYVLKGEAEFLLKYNKKTRCCHDCERTYNDVGTIWCLADAPDRYGEMLPIDLPERCLECEMKEFIALKRLDCIKPS
jgi:hypothetical protein